MKRILFLCPVGEKGGAETVLLDIASRLDRAAYTPIIACLKPGPFVEELNAMGIGAQSLQAHQTRQLHKVAAAIRTLRSMIKKEQIDIVHANGSSMLLYAGLAAARTHAKVVWQVHDPLRGGGMFERAFVTVQRRLRPHWTIFSNPVVAGSYLKTYQNLTHNTTILPGVDTSRLSSEADPCRVLTQLGISVSAPVFVMFARLQRAKGHEVLMDASLKVLREFPDARFVVCGGSFFGREPDYPAEIERMIDARGIRSNFIMRGYVSDQEKRDLLAAAVAVVHPALFEPFGLSVIEGMAAGKPVVATDCAGPKMTVVNGETGFLVKRGDSSELAEAMIKILKNPKNAERMGKRGRLRTNELYSVTAMVRQIELIYEQIGVPGPMPTDGNIHLEFDSAVAGKGGDVAR